MKGQENKFLSKIEISPFINFICILSLINFNGILIRASNKSLIKFIGQLLNRAGLSITIPSLIILLIAEFNKISIIASKFSICIISQYAIVIRILKIFSFKK